MTRKPPWKQSHRALPQSIVADLQLIKSPYVIVAATKKIPSRDIASGLYAHLGLKIDGDEIANPGRIIPLPETGLFSGRNAMGWEVKRTDLPKIAKTYSWETPNFGDGSTYGYHTHSHTREVYQQQVFEPRNYALSIELLNSPGADAALLKFAVDQVLDLDAEGFEDELLFCLNLLQENTGVSGVFASDATRDDFIGTVHLDWEVFPPGNADELIASLAKGKARLTPEKTGIVASRLKLFGKLPIEKLIKGINSFGAYIGALYAEDLVVFENMNYANWQDVSKRSRLELLRGTSEGFDRFVHTDGWEDRFQHHMQSELKKRGRYGRRR